MTAGHKGLAQVQARWARLSVADCSRFNHLIMPVVLEALADAPCLGHPGDDLTGCTAAAIAKWRPAYVAAAITVLDQL